MKLLHTADWHLGRTFHGFPLIEEQGALLGQIVETARAERPDVVVVAGDVYDRAVPPREAVELLDSVLTRLVLDVGVPTILIAGNHDSSERLEFARRFLSREGLHVIGEPEPDAEPIVIAGVSIYAIPYAEPALVRHILQTESIRSREEAMRALVARVRSRGLGARSILVAHEFVTGGSPSESERPLSVGTVESISLDVFSGFDYVALGHLHRPQSLGSSRLRYAGSPFPYSFSEADQEKSASIVEIGSEGEVSVREATLRPIRKVRVIRGLFDELLHSAPSDDYILAEMLDTRVVYNPYLRLKERFPNLADCRYARLERTSPLTGTSPERLRRDRLALFGDFVREVAGRELTEKERTIMTEVLEELARTERQERR